MIHVGTSGFSYDDWLGHFYPERIPKREMLRFYAERFNAVELNFTYYRLPSARTLAQMSAKTPEDFCFVVKANQEMTHDRTGKEAVFQSFAEALQPLIEEGKLGCILAQFPWSFKVERANVEYLRWFREMLPDLPTVVEFRNSRWVRDETFELLRKLDFGFCCVDEPRLKGLMPPVARATSDVGYVRFHGRNAEAWWKHEHAWQRYDYLYSREELVEWVPKVQDIAGSTGKTLVFFNNHYEGKAAANASLFRDLLAGSEG